ncbi:hypothetical protein TNCV_1436601 [Trichonephila clavipes]|nr:hypothetical protein TNCV_1436601 [Trichonephila clavipes]
MRSSSPIFRSKSFVLESSRMLLKLITTNFSLARRLIVNLENPFVVWIHETLTIMSCLEMLVLIFSVLEPLQLMTSGIDLKQYRMICPYPSSKSYSMPNRIIKPLYLPETAAVCSNFGEPVYSQIVVVYRAFTPQVRGSNPGLGKVYSVFHPFSGSIK